MKKGLYLHHHLVSVANHVLHFAAHALHETLVVSAATHALEATNLVFARQHLHTITAQDAPVREGHRLDLVRRLANEHHPRLATRHARNKPLLVFTFSQSCLRAWGAMGITSLFNICQQVAPEAVKRVANAKGASGGARLCVRGLGVADACARGADACFGVSRFGPL
jgi:hypothetical protein